MKSSSQRLRCRRQSILARGARDDSRPWKAPLTIQPRFERIKHIRDSLILVDAHWSSDSRCGRQVALDRLTHLNVVEVDHRTANHLGEAAQHRRLSHRPRAMQGDHRLDPHLLSKKIADTTGNKSIQLHALDLANVSFQTLQT